MHLLYSNKGIGDLKVSTLNQYGTSRYQTYKLNGEIT